MLFRRNTFFTLALVFASALAQFQHGSNCQITAPSGGSWSNSTDLNFCADVATSSVIFQPGACNSTAQGTWGINQPQMRSHQTGYTFNANSGDGDGCGRFACPLTLNAESTPGSTVHLGTDASSFELMHVNDDMYKVASTANPSLYWTLQPLEGNPAGSSSIVLKELMDDGSLQTFRFVGRD